MVRQLQPGVIIDNRLEVSGEGFGSLWEGDPTPYHGDFVSPEQIIPPDGLRDKQGRTWCGRPASHEQQLGLLPERRFYKPASMLNKKLVECVPRGATCS